MTQRYAISATVCTARDHYQTSRQVPTFYLDARVQGLISEGHARRVALDVIDPTGTLRESHAVIDVCAVAL